MVGEISNPGATPAQIAQAQRTGNFWVNLPGFSAVGAPAAVAIGAILANGLNGLNTVFGTRFGNNAGTSGPGGMGNSFDPSSGPCSGMPSCGNLNSGFLNQPGGPGAGGMQNQMMQMMQNMMQMCNQMMQTLQRLLPNPTSPTGVTGGSGATAASGGTAASGATGPMASISRTVNNTLGRIAANGSGNPVDNPTLVTQSLSICSMFDIFNYYLQGGNIDVGFLGGAQVDRFGNINSTVIGSYDSPKVRLPGSGGACEIATHAKRLIIITSQSLRTFPEKVDFMTSPGFIDINSANTRRGLPGRGPQIVITDKGIFRPHPKTKELMLISIHPNVSLEEVRANTGWDLQVSSECGVTPEPTEKDLSILRTLFP